MSDEWNIEFNGLDNLIKECEELATESELNNTNKKILKKCGNLAYTTVKPLIHRSKDHSKSGAKHKGQPRLTPPQHASDAVPKPRLKTNRGNLQCIVGWQKNDISEYWYMKCEEWGSTKRPPHHSFGIVNKLLRKDYDEIAEKEYSKLVKKLE